MHRRRDVASATIPAPSAATRAALAGPSTNSGMNASGTPAASAASVPPEPPWPTIAAACGMTAPWATQRSTWTFAGSGPSAAGSTWRPIVISTRFGTSASACAVARNSSGVADLRAEGDVDERRVDPLAGGMAEAVDAGSPSPNGRERDAPARRGGTGRAARARARRARAGRRRRRSRRSRCGPTSTTGTSKCAAATHEANSVVSRTIRSGASLLDEREHPRAARRGRRGRRTAPGSRARRPGASLAKTGAQRSRRGPTARPGRRRRSPARSTIPRAEPGAATRTSCPARPRRGRTAPAGRSARRPGRSRRESAYGFRDDALARSYSR